MMRRKDLHNIKPGDHLYEGYLIDLMDEIAKQLKFKYQLYEPPDGFYGAYNKKTKKWTGMIQELIIGVIAIFISFLIANNVSIRLLSFKVER